MAIANHTFCWSGIVSTKPSATLTFFSEVFGWKAQTVDMGGSPTTLLANGDVPIAHVREPQEGEPGSWWNNYFRVEDVDAAAQIAASKGAVLVPPTDIVPGRFATITTPSGAVFTLFRESDSSDLPVGTGFVHWVDLHSTDLPADLAFLAALGVDNKVMDMPNGPYHLLGLDGATRSGAMTGQNPEAPAHWVAWVEVENADDALARATNHGGAALAPVWNAEGVGRMAIVREPHRRGVRHHRTPRRLT